MKLRNGDALFGDGKGIKVGRHTDLHIWTDGTDQIHADIIRDMMFSSSTDDLLMIKPTAGQVWIKNLRDENGDPISGSSTSLIALTDTPSGYDDGKYLRSTPSGTEWATVSGGVSTFLALSDTPGGYDNGKLLRSTAVGIEFFTADYASSGHNHDGTYATLVHNHDGDYAAIVHTHIEFLDHTNFVTLVEARAEVTYENLDANGDVGTSAGKLAIGNHTHPITPAEIDIYNNGFYHSTTGSVNLNDGLVASDGTGFTTISFERELTEFMIDDGAPSQATGLENDHYMDAVGLNLYKKDTNATSDITYGGTPSASTNTASSGLACDYNHYTKFQPGAQGGNDFWWKYDYGAGNEQIISKITIVGWFVENTKTIHFEGSNDGSIWTDLLTVTGFGQSDYDSTSYTFANSTAYQQYRLVIYQAETPPSDYMGLQEVKLLTEAAIDWDLKVEFGNSLWHYGTSSPPSQAIGTPDDFYLDTANLNLYQKTVQSFTQVLYSSVTTGFSPSANIYDGDPNTVATANLYSEGVNVTIDLGPGNATIVDRTYVHFNNGSGGARYTLSGSNDTTTWLTLDEHHITPPGIYTSTDDFTNPDAYRYYRFMFKRTNMGFNIHEIELYSTAAYIWDYKANLVGAWSDDATASWGDDRDLMIWYDSTAGYNKVEISNTALAFAIHDGTTSIDTFILSPNGITMADWVLIEEYLTVDGTVSASEYHSDSDLILKSQGVTVFSSDGTDTDIIADGTTVFTSDGTTNSLTGSFLVNSGAIVEQGHLTFTDTDTTPSISGGNNFKTNAGSSSLTIIDFDDGYDGQRIHIIFVNSEVTVADGTGIYLASADDWTPDAKDTLTLTFDGSNWYERTRSDNSA